MKFLVWLLVGIFFSGCLANRAEFEAINVGKINAVYENGALKLANLACGDLSLDKHSTDLKVADLSLQKKEHSELLWQSKNKIIDCHDSTQGVKSRNDRIVANSAQSTPFILFFFTTTCDVCKAQIPILQEMANENIRIYGILGNIPSVEKAKKYTQSNAITLPIFYESKAKQFFTQVIGGVKGVPVVIIFDKDGKIKKRFIGLTPKSILNNAIS